MRKAMPAAIALVLAVPVQAEEAKLPGWLSGCWEQIEGDRWTEECWTSPRGGILIGSGRNGVGGELRGWEAMQIVRGADGRLTFWASPDGAPRSAFPMTSQNDREIVFTNPRHDYPQRVRYWRDGGLLKAEIAMADGSKAAGFTFRPLGAR